MNYFLGLNFITSRFLLTSEKVFAKINLHTKRLTTVLVVVDGKCQ